MKKIFQIFIPVLICVLAISACGLPVRMTEARGSGSVLTETRRVSGFNAIDLSGIGTLIITQGDKESLEITAEDNLLEHLRSDVLDSRLLLRTDNFVNIHPTRDIIYLLTVKNLNQIDLSGLGKIESKKLETDHLSIDISGNGRTSIDNLSADSLALDISGLGDFTASGDAAEMDVEISGAGNIKAPNLETRSAKVAISGTGNAIIWVADSLQIDLSGLGQVHYYGNPTLQSDVSGAGSVKSLGDK